MSLNEFYLNKTDIIDKKLIYKRITIIGISFNLLLFLIKVIIGLFLSSISIIADSFNNLSDTGTVIILGISSKISLKPADYEHPHGHGRAEYVSSLIISLIIFMIGIQFFSSSIGSIINPNQLKFNFIMLLFLILSIIIKIVLYIMYKKFGKKLNSTSVNTLAKDSFFDAIITLSTILSISYFAIFKINIDGYIGCLISIFIIYSGIDSSKNSIDLLIGKSIDKKTINKIKSIIMLNDNIYGIHKILLHSYGSDNIVGCLDVDINKDLSFIDAHKIIDEIENTIKENLGIEIIIHMDPK
ncbi:MAG: cation transporter [Oscillospiraceae bacterium]|nr:cation transporter [Oscillospiraceae bacterium]